MTDTKTEPLVSDETFQNLFIRYCNMQDGHDLIIVRKADADEMIAVVRGALDNLPPKTVFVTKCDVLVVDEDWYYDWRARAEALLARLDKAVTDD